MLHDKQVGCLSYNSPVNNQNKSDPCYTSFIRDFAHLIELVKIIPGHKYYF